MKKLVSFVLFLVIICMFIGHGEAESKSFLVNCGSDSVLKIDGRTWVGDLSPNTNFTLSLSSSSTTASLINASDSISIYPELYKSARIFTSRGNYTFKGVQGSTYFVRLHFCPFSFENHNVNESSFDVFANNLKLVSEFDVPGEIKHKNSNRSSIFLVKEYVLQLTSDDKLVVEFIPSKGSFGFVNAVEITLAVDNLFPGSASKGIETMYRLNVGGPEINPGQDLDLYRTWEMDSSYMITADAGSVISNSSSITYSNSSVAPLLVYETARTMSNNQVLEKRFNMSWKFEVNPEFDYLVRLHFCELVYGKVHQRNFRIYISNQTAASNYDIYANAGGKNKALHQDYFDTVSSKINTLWVQLGPDTTIGSLGTDALLNGLEIFKLSRNGNLAYVERFGLNVSHPRLRILWILVAAGLATIVILGVVCIVCMCFCRFRRVGSYDTKDVYNTKDVSPGHNSRIRSMVASTRAGKKFTLAEIRVATNNFDESLVIGVGGFGKVYKGGMVEGTLTAIKRAHPQSQQGLREFETEIELLSKLRHRHLVSLVGFCEEQTEMILVYEYMANGTLRSHLFGSDCPPLDWKQRLQVCIGAARGLHYLHTSSERGIIHRDVKTTNILLDDNFVAKMSDFGLSKTGPSLDHTHVSTAVKGSFGYLDPEYFRTQQLTEKSDVYSFGVVLFEVICARPVINPGLPREQINLAEWAMKWQRKRLLEKIIDPNLGGNYCPESVVKFGEMAEKCVAEEGKSRPTMGEILWHLEYVLQLHEAWLDAENGGGAVSSSQGSRRTDGVDL